MENLERRIDRIEEQLGPDKGPCLRFPMGNGEFIELPAGLTLNDPQIALRVAGRDKSDVSDDDDRIRQNPTF